MRWLNIQSPGKPPPATPTKVAVRRRAEGAVSASAAPAANAVYLDYARHYLKAREGILPAEPDPVL